VLLRQLYPSDPWQAALCDEIMEAVEDINGKISSTLFLPEDQKKAQREVCAQRHLKSSVRSVLEMCARKVGRHPDCQDC
jgi:hypothetical protein